MKYIVHLTFLSTNGIQIQGYLTKNLKKEYYSKVDQAVIFGNLLTAMLTVEALKEKYSIIGVKYINIKSNDIFTFSSGKINTAEELEEIIAGVIKYDDNIHEHKVKVNVSSGLDIDIRWDNVYSLNITSTKVTFNVNSLTWKLGQFEYRLPSDDLINDLVCICQLYKDDEDLSKFLEKYNINIKQL